MALPSFTVDLRPTRCRSLGAAVWVGLGAVQLLAGAEGLESRALHPRHAPPPGATLFTTLSPEQTGLTVVNHYDDPAMWGARYREFSLGAIGTGVAIGDYDGDGRPDIFVVSKTGPNHLYRNLGDFHFEDVTEKAGVAGPTGAWKQGVAFADVNNDGRLDLYVCRFGAPNLLYINQGDGTFKEEAAARGLALNDASSMAAFCDYDRDGWLDVYLSAPVMRFAWAPGVADAQHWWFGLLMPSCDNVGRYFPLLIAHPRTRPPLDRIALDHLESWFDHLAKAAAHTLGDQASIESFERALSDAPPWPTPSARTWLPPRAMPDSPPSTERYQLGRHATLNQWLYSMAIDDLHVRFSGCTIWWRRSAVGQESIASVVRGLPDPSAFAQMLSGS